MSGKTDYKSAALRYSAPHYDQYFRQLKAECKKSKGGQILSKLVTDPISEFLDLQLTKIEDHVEVKRSTAEQKSPSDDDNDLEETPEKRIKNLIMKADADEDAEAMLKALKALKIPSQKSFKEDPETEAYRFRKQVKKSPVFSREDKKMLDENLQHWIHSESIIYAIVVSTLKDASQYIIDPEGAGRAQLDHLQNTHKKSTKSSTKTLKRIFENFKYKQGPPAEGLSRYLQRLQGLVKEMSQAKPTPLVRNDEEILDTYREGLARVSMYKDELRSCDIGRYDLLETHAYLLENENVRGVHLRNLHGLSSKQLGLVDVNNADGDMDGKRDGKELCSHFCKTGRCRFGSKCKFEHPKWLVETLRKSRGICRNFQTGKCKYGDDCMYQHVKSKTADAEAAATEPVDAENNNAELQDEGAAKAENFNFGELLNFDTAEDAPEEAENAAELGPQDFNFHFENDNPGSDADDDRSCDTQDQILFGYNQTPTSEIEEELSDVTTDEETRQARAMPGTPPPAKIARTTSPTAGLTDSSLTPDQYYVASPDYLFNRPENLFQPDFDLENDAASENSVLQDATTENSIPQSLFSDEFDLENVARNIARKIIQNTAACDNAVSENAAACENNNKTATADNNNKTATAENNNKTATAENSKTATADHNTTATAENNNKTTKTATAENPITATADSSTTAIAENLREVNEPSTNDHRLNHNRNRLTNKSQLSTNRTKELTKSKSTTSDAIQDKTRRSIENNRDRYRHRSQCNLNLFSHFNFYIVILLYSIFQFSLHWSSFSDQIFSVSLTGYMLSTLDVDLALKGLSSVSKTPIWINNKINSVCETTIPNRKQRRYFKKLIRKRVKQNRTQRRKLNNKSENAPTTQVCSLCHSEGDILWYEGSKIRKMCQCTLDRLSEGEIVHERSSLNDQLPPSDPPDSEIDQLCRCMCLPEVNQIEYDIHGKDKDRRPILDSGASHCITPFVNDLTNTTTRNHGKIRGVTGTTRINVSGTLTSITGGTIDNVLLLKSASRPLISTKKLLKQFGGYVVLGSQNATHISNEKKRTILGPKDSQGWYRIDRLPETTRSDVNNLTLINQLKREKVQRLHRCLGHASANKIRQILSTVPLMGLHPHDVKLLQKCESCGLGKPRRSSHKRKAQRKPTGFGSHLCCDNTGLQRVQTRGGKRIVNVVVCKYTQTGPSLLHYDL